MAKCNLFHLPVGTKFYVLNGAWDGQIIEEDGIKKLLVADTGKKIELTEEIGKYDLDITIKEWGDIPCEEKN
ncbi:hypothetical protein [Brevibacillus laterosporus]|uniref:hypothetical protein n=1 Tax=Brevibacillus laterosporus TaxID=1465 RepID=UPI003D1DD515